MPFLDEELSLGLASSPQTEMLPAVGAPQQMGAFDEGQFSQFDVGLRGGGAQGLGLATPAKPGARTQSEEEYLKSLPTTMKIGLALESFAAGMRGAPSPIDRVLERKRRMDQDHRADLVNTINVITKGTEVLRKMPQGTARDAVAAQLSKAVGGGELGEVFKLAGDQQQEVKSVLSTFSDPDVQNRLLTACSGAQDFRACVMQQARDKDFMDRAHAEADAKRIPAVVKKLGAITDQLGKTGVLDEYKGEDGKYSVPFAKLLELNGTGDKAIFTPDELATLKRNDTLLSPFGIKPQKAIEAGAVERAKQAEKPVKEWSEPYTLNGALVQKNAATGEIRTAVSRPPREKADKPADKPLTLSQERADEKILAARDKVKGLTFKDVQRLSQKTVIDERGMDTLRLNKDHDPTIMQAWRLAAQPTFEETKAKREAAKGESPKPKAAEAPKADTTFANADDVRRAYKAGTIDREAAKRALKKFGYQ